MTTGLALGPVRACTSCGDPIRWARTTRGRRMPVDAEPTPNGNVVLTVRYPGEPPLASVYRDPTAARAAAEADGGDVYLSHFVTCRHAGQHRRARAG